MAAIQAQPDIVSAARDLVPLVLARREEAERLRRLTPDVAEAFRQAGLFQMYLPRSMGGLELHPLTVFDAVETISRADGSAGWCAMIATIMSGFLGWVPVEIGRALAGAPADYRAAGSLRPQGRAVAVGGGYRVTGRWDFASGIDHARYLKCSCIVMDGDKPVLTPAGLPRMRAMLVPAEQARVIDTWEVVGMRATCSQDFVVEDVFVLAEHSYFVGDPPFEAGTLYHPRLVQSVFWTATVANALGIARGAIDTFVEMASTATTTLSTSVLRDRPLVQTRVAEAEAIVNGARAYVFDAVGKAWRVVEDGAGDPSAAVAQARLAIVHGMHEAKRAVDLVFHAAGTNAVYSRNPLERYFRDVHVAVQHGAALPVHYESAGKALMGLRPTDPGW